MLYLNKALMLSREEVGQPREETGRKFGSTYVKCWCKDPLPLQLKSNKRVLRGSLLELFS